MHITCTRFDFEYHQIDLYSVLDAFISQTLLYLCFQLGESDKNKFTFRSFMAFCSLI